MRIRQKLDSMGVSAPEHADWTQCETSKAAHVFVTPKTAQNNANLPCKHFYIYSKNMVNLDHHLSLTVWARPPQFTVLAQVVQIFPKRDAIESGLGRRHRRQHCPCRRALPLFWAQPPQITILANVVQFLPNQVAIESVKAMSSSVSSLTHPSMIAIPVSSPPLFALSVARPNWMVN